QCDLAGDWKNDLGSNMTINEVKENGDFTGTYFMAVPDNPAVIKELPLLGSQHVPHQLYQPTFGFTVRWTFANSICVFMGQCFMDDYGKEVLKTMWLLRSHEKNIKDDWKA
ncbi:AVID protein, partial [Leptocoma aspasia]|nr:AVID protein [Leptocoma aspasia]